MLTKSETNRRTFLVLAASTVIACKGKHSRTTVQNEEEPAPQLQSVVQMNDARAGAQLVSGFHAVENNAWRWTAGKFSVLLRVPPAAAQKGAIVRLSCTIPDVVIQKLSHIALTASVGDMVLGTEEYEKPGAEMFTADLLPAMLTGDSVRIDFMVDQTLPKENDKRELGLIANSVALEAK